MNTKLTLSLDKDVIIRAKTYAKFMDKSLSQIIEDYLKLISNTDKVSNTDIEIPSITKSLNGILKGKPEVDFKNEITEYMMRKYQ